MEAETFFLQTRNGRLRKASMPRSPTGSCSVSLPPPTHPMVLMSREMYLIAGSVLKSNVLCLGFSRHVLFSDSRDRRKRSVLPAILRALCETDYVHRKGNVNHND